MKAIFEILNGEYVGRRMALRSPVRLTVGRTALADYMVPYDNQLSSIHFAVEMEDGVVFVKDLGSTNGTRVNGETIHHHRLAPGDQIQAGDSLFSVTMDEATVVESAPSVAVDAFPEEPTNPTATAMAPMIDPSNGRPSSHTSSGNMVLPPFDRGFVDDCPEVIQSSLETAIWTRQVWLLPYCRTLALKSELAPTAFYEILAILAEPADVSLVQNVVANPELGVARFRIAGLLGSPHLFPLLLKHFRDADVRIAVEAGRAFCKITAADVESDERVTLPPQEESVVDEFEQAFLDEARLPDLAKAEAFLSRESERFQSSPRWAAGIDVQGPLAAETFMALDLEARWEAALRGVYRAELRLGLAQLLKMRPLLVASR